MKSRENDRISVFLFISKFKRKLEVASTKLLFGGSSPKIRSYVRSLGLSRFWMVLIHLEIMDLKTWARFLVACLFRGFWWRSGITCHGASVFFFNCPDHVTRRTCATCAIKIHQAELERYCKTTVNPVNPVNPHWICCILTILSSTCGALVQHGNPMLKSHGFPTSWWGGPEGSKIVASPDPGEKTCEKIPEIKKI